MKAFTLVAALWLCMSAAARDYVITDYGAVADTTTVNTSAFAAAVEACAQGGGGRVVVPRGTWLTGPIHLASRVYLHLEEGAVVRFTDNPADYLPAVPTSWEGMECYNYSPLVYAYDCDSVGITGSGMLAPKMDTWRTWFGRPQPHLDALRELYTMASTDVPVEERQMAKGDNHLRPHLVQFNRCRDVLLDGFTIRESPFWTIHLYLCERAEVRNLDVRAHGHNNDGIDVEMSRDVLIEDCLFDQGDDGVVIKSGRNQDAWRINRPTENVEIRNCTVRQGHCLLGIGSEISGGVRNVHMHHCQAPDTVIRLFFIKTNHRRGGFIENIRMDHVEARRMSRVLEIDADVLYQWRDLVPTYKDSLTLIRDIYIDSIRCERAERVYELKEDPRAPVQGVHIGQIDVGEVTGSGSHF